MATNPNRKDYIPSDFGKKEEEMMQDFQLQKEDARNYFLNVIKPRLDRSYKLYIAYTGDRQREIKSWQANVFVPYVQAVVETLMPRVLDARPEFSVLGRSPEDHIKAEKQQQLGDYYWEIAKMDKTTEDYVRSAMVYGTGYLQVYWKKDVRELKFLKTKDLTSKKLSWKKEKRTFYDAPYAEWVDNYSLWYDWHNSSRESKQYWFKRLVLTEEEIRRRYPGADKKRLDMAFNKDGGDLTDYAAIRQQARYAHDRIVKGANVRAGSVWDSSNSYSDKYGTALDSKTQMYEVFEWYQPFKDFYSVIVGGGEVPILKGGSMPLPFDFKEAPFIELPYLKIPGEFEGYGLPLILENPQIMLNLIKNQRLDAATLNIHKMWVVNPLANINKTELVTRPFGIIYSIDPNGVKEVQFSDLKASAYKEEEMLKGDMRYSSGVDDFSMGVGGGAASATEVRHLRESTLERVRLFVNHLGDAYSDVLRYWMDMSRQMMSKKVTMRIIGDDGEAVYPLIEKEDLMGRYDYKAKVLPSIAGQQDVNKKQAMDLFQLLSQIDPQMSGIDLRKLISRTINNWGWSLESISSEEPMGQEMPPEMAGMEGGDLPPELAAMMQGGGQVPPELAGMMQGGGQPPMGGPQGPAPSPTLQNALGMLRGPADAAQPGPFAQMQQPVNLLEAQGPPPTPRGVPSGGAGGRGPARPNVRGFNRNGRVNTNITTGNRGGSSVESNLLNRAFNIQR
jgi:hypothetical protein